MLPMSGERHPSGFGTPFHTLIEHFESVGVRFSSDHEEKLIFFAMCGDVAIYNCRFRVTHDDDVLQIDLGIPVLARGPKIREQVAEVVTRANRGLPVGRFDIDLSDGQVSFHIGHAIAPSGLDDATVRRLFGTAMATVDRYFPALMRVMYGGHTPEDAVYLSELETHSESAGDAVAPRASSAETKPAPPPVVRAPTKKRARRARKDVRRRKSGDLPGLFDPAEGEGNGSAEKDRPS